MVTKVRAMLVMRPLLTHQLHFTITQASPSRVLTVACSMQPAVIASPDINTAADGVLV